MEPKLLSPEEKARRDLHYRFEDVTDELYILDACCDGMHRDDIEKLQITGLMLQFNRVSEKFDALFKAWLKPQGEKAKKETDFPNK